MVLNQAPQGIARSRYEVLVVGIRNLLSFGLCDSILWEMHIHFLDKVSRSRTYSRKEHTITVKVCIVRVAVAVCLELWNAKYRFELTNSHNACGLSSRLGELLLYGTSY